MAQTHKGKSTTATSKTDDTIIPSLQDKEHETQYLSTLLPNDSLTTTPAATKKRNRPLNKTTVRNMITWSHYQFFTRLQHKLGSSRLLECTEEYTTKTCGNCGELHRNIGSNKIFKCPHCEQYESDRDHNAARNIMLKVFTQLQFSAHGSLA
jgi:transposase